MTTPAPTIEDPSTSTTVPQSILDKLDPEYRAFVLTRPPHSRLPIHNLTWSSDFREVEKSNPPELGEEPGVPVGSTKTVELDGFTAKMLTPEGEPPKSGWPVLIWIHGGGWVFGSAESGVSTYSRACVEARCVVLSVEYRRAPEYPFPYPLDDSWSTLLWVREKGKEQSLDASRIAVGGASAGGNLAAALAQRAALASPPIKLALQVLGVPVTNCTFSADDQSGWTPSMIEYADIYSLRALDMLWLRDLYIPDKSQRSLPDASPLLQENPQAFKEMAPAWVGVVELDVLRSEGEAYAEKLKNNGVPVTFKIYKGATHLTPAADRVCALARTIRDDQVEAIKLAFAS